MEVKVMTDNFQEKIEEHCHGTRCHGTMYHGKLPTGQEVAVKVWAPRAPRAPISHPALIFPSAAEEFHQFEKVRSPIS